MLPQHWFRTYQKVDSRQNANRSSGQAINFADNSSTKTSLSSNLVLTRCIAVLSLFALLSSTHDPNPALAGEVRLKNGMVLKGDLIPILGLTERARRQAQGPTSPKTMLMVSTGMTRHYLSKRQADEFNRDVDLSGTETFTLRQRRTGQKKIIASLGRIREVVPFDQFGRRQVSIRTAKGKRTVEQGITEIRPDYITLVGLTHKWEHAIATTSVPPKILDRILRTATDQTNSGDRMAIARFYLQAGMYPQALQEIDSVIKDFPELKQTAEETRLQLKQ